MESLQLATAPDGTFFVLTKPHPFSNPNIHPIQLIRFANGTSTTETIRDILSRYDERSLAVTADGTPVIAWTNSAPGIPRYLWLRRVTPTGPQVIEMRVPADWRKASKIAATGAATPTLFVSGYDAEPHLLRETVSGLTEVVPTKDISAEFGMFSAASTDASGTTTSCSRGRTTYSLIEATVDATGAGELRQIVSAPEPWSWPQAHFCIPITDSQGRSHLIFGDDTVYVHAQVE